MRKIRLDVEGLAVDSFATHAEGTDAGTVRGHERTNAWDCVYSLTGTEHCPCDSEASCFDCIHSAVATCQFTCTAPGCDGPTNFELTCSFTCRWGPGGFPYEDVNC